MYASVLIGVGNMLLTLQKHEYVACRDIVHWLDSMVLEIFSRLDDSMVL